MRVTAWLFATCVLPVVLLMARPAWAAVVIIYVEGDDAKTIASELAAAVPEGVETRDGAAVAAALDKRKLRGKLAASLANKRDRPKALDALGEAARDGDAVVAATSKKGPRGASTVTLVVVKAGAREPDVESAANDPAARKAVLARSLAPLAPPPKKATVDEKPPPEHETEHAAASPRASASPRAEPPRDERGGISRATLLLYAGVMSGSRFYDYNEPLTPGLRDYQLTTSLHATVSGELYPLARTRIRVLRDLGFEGRYSRVLGLESTVRGTNVPVSTTWERFYVGGRGRLRLGEGDTPSILCVSIGWGRTVFAFDGLTDPVNRTDPAMRTDRLLAGVDLRVPVVRHFAFFGGVAGGLVLVGEPQSARFPHARAGNVAFSLGAAFPLVEHLEARVAFTYDRTFFAFDSKRGDTYVAGGALDHNLFGSLELGLWL